MELLDQIKNGGIIGAGGAGFPTHAKLAGEAEFILMNGAECEPLLRVDQQLMEFMPDEIIQGFNAAGKIVKAKRAIIGIKKKHGRVIEILRERIEALGLGEYIFIGELPDIYPAGDEQVLVHELTGRVVPEAGIPIMVGCVVVNSETALNIYRAMQGEAVTKTYVTLAGDIPNRLTLKVPVGTPITDVLKLSGIENFEEYAVIDGGPMMGPVMHTIGGYMTKKQKGFVILKKSHPLIKKKTASMAQAVRVNRGACEQCRLCTDLCPRYLLGHNMQPHKMMRAMTYNFGEGEGQKIAQLCCQCGLCEFFSCPAGLFPKQANMFFKAKQLENKDKYERKQEVFSARECREYRLVPSKRLIARLGLKDFDKAAPFEKIELSPEVVKISLRQHVGAPAEPIVKAGDRVETGQMIGKVPENALGAPIHASITGKIEEVDQDFITIRRN